ncbi:DUF4382 domain-containing protein [Geobacter argillaceus]|uniref:Uncharacterized protein DUF4382 n=1 Tax=Geobacter argillaceus TaxID=345631 RepID=A0A562WRD2_9BACT|nr:DUF4382 domain-containing protein [Geobacter argillaceus]TWJ32706.1 uncharacterized protein DUF4382 [Geobacter argillaceus]
MKGIGRILRPAVAMFSLALLLAGCGSSSPGDTTPAGTVDVDVTDAASIDYAHVYVTVRAVAFHTVDTKGFRLFSTNHVFKSYTANRAVQTSDWQVQTLPAPVTVDLAQLANGTVYADTNGKSLFSGIKLPEGKYQQIRIILAPTEGSYMGSITGLTYNNEVQLPNDTTHYPLRVPSAAEGIKLVPESPVVVTAGASVKLVLDFNLNNDVVKVSPNNQTEFILKPRLGYFDMNRVASITGKVSFGNLTTSRFVIKAEQVAANKTYRIVRRWTSVDKTTGKFNLYPLPVFGTATTATYDILLRGRNVQTAIVKGVKVHKGTTIASGVNLGTIAMQTGSEFTAQLQNAYHPSGAWLNFYQTIAGDSIPYEVRYRHLNPYTGKFFAPIELSTGPIQVASFDNAAQTVGAFTADTTSQGSFSAIVEASFYGRGTPVTVANGASPVSFAPSVLAALPSANSITANVTIPLTLTGLTKGHLFITHGGLVIDSYQVDSLIAAGGGQYTVLNLPGGTTTTPLAGAYYGVNVFGWGGGKIASGSLQHLDLTTGSVPTTGNTPPAITLRSGL